MQQLEQNSYAKGHAIISVTTAFLVSTYNQTRYILEPEIWFKILKTPLSIYLSASYSKARLLEAAAILQTELEITPSGFGQFFFVNVDFNVSILDGFNTFHSVGGVSCETSATALVPRQPADR